MSEAVAESDHGIISPEIPLEPANEELQLIIGGVIIKSIELKRYCLSNL